MRTGSARRRLVAVLTATAAAALVAVTLTSAPLGAQGAAEPTVEVQAQRAAPGTEVFTKGSGWPAGAMVRLETCGNEALDGSVDCDVAGATLVGTRGDGTFTTRFTVTAPPTPCPCVVVATNDGTTIATSQSFEVIGHPQALPQPSFGLDEPRLAVDARLEGSGTWASWFGAAPERTLVLRVRNDSRIDLSEQAVSVRIGRGDEPDGFVPAPTLQPLGAGEETTLEIPVRFDALSIGSYTVQAHVGTGVYQATATTDTFLLPWALAVLLLLAVEALVVVVGWRIRRRRRRRAAVAAAGALVSAGAPGDPGAPGAEEPVLAADPEREPVST